MAEDEKQEDEKQEDEKQEDEKQEDVHPSLGTQIERQGFQFVDASGQGMAAEFLEAFAEALINAGLMKVEDGKMQPTAGFQDGFHGLDMSFDDDGKMTVEMVPVAEVAAVAERFKKEAN